MFLERYDNKTRSEEFPNAQDVRFLGFDRDADRW